MHDILMIGVGYVGLVSATCFAEMGNRVCCLDKNPEKIALLKQSHIPIYEPGLEELVVRNSKNKRLTFTTDYKEAVEKAQICILAVDTPQGPDNACDLRSLKKAVATIGQYMNGYKLIINKSTAPVGTTRIIRQELLDALEERGVDFDFDVVSNPEFLKEGSAISDFMKPDRVVIGVDSDRARTLMRELYRPFMLQSDRLIEMDPASSELTKYGANCMLALRVSFMNWMASLCESSGANILQVRRGIGSDKRIGSAFLWAGMGFGGSCFPKDIQALKYMAENAGIATLFIDAIDQVNEAQKELLGKKIKRYYRQALQDVTIGILGLSFKPDTDDIREAPSLVLIRQLLDDGAKLRLYDPSAMDNAKKVLGENEAICWCDDEYDAAVGADAIALVTEWKQFRLLDFQRIRQVMKGNAFFDGRNQYCPKEMGRLGFDYISIGQAPVSAVLEKEFVSQEVVSKVLKSR